MTMYLYIGAAAVALIGGVAAFFYIKRIGKNEEKLEQAEEILDDIYLANSIRNLNNDDIGKLHDKYE